MNKLFPYTDFLKTFGVPKDIISVDLDDKYIAPLPEGIKVFYTENMSGSYKNGLISFINPRDYISILPLFLSNPEDFIVFAITGYGDMYLYNASGIYMIDVRDSSLFKIGKNPATFFEVYLSCHEYVKDFLWIDLFRQATKKLGKLRCNEIYSFNPALQLGGEAILENIKKDKIKEHLLFLSQIKDIDM